MRFAQESFLILFEKYLRLYHDAIFLLFKHFFMGSLPLPLSFRGFLPNLHKPIHGYLLLPMESHIECLLLQPVR